MGDRLVDRPREKMHEGADKAQNVFHSIQERAPTTRQVLGLFALLAVGAVVLVLGGLTVGGAILGLIALTPVLIFFSPVLVPLATILFFTVGGFFVAAATAVAAFSGVSWLYNYVKGRHPPGSDQVEAARNRLSETAAHVKERAHLKVDTDEALGSFGGDTASESPSPPGSGRHDEHRQRSYRRSRSATSPEGRRVTTGSGGHGSFRKMLSHLRDSFAVPYS